MNFPKYFIKYLYVVLISLVSIQQASAALFPTVNTWCYCLQHMNSFGGDSAVRFWTSHYDVLIGSEPYDVVNAASPSTILLAYTLSTNLTAYNADNNSYKYDLLRLKNWIDTAFSNPDSTFESCFLHIKDTTLTIRFSSGGTMTVPPYDPANPRASRLPGTWQKNSDWTMNFTSNAYRRYWREVLAPYYLKNTDGIYLDVQTWPNGQIIPSSGKILEFTSNQVFYDSLVAVTKDCLETVHNYGSDKFLAENNFGWDSGGTGNFQLYHVTDFALHEANLAWSYNSHRIKKEIEGAIGTRDSGTYVLMQHRGEFRENFPKEQHDEINKRDQMVGLSIFLMCAGDGIYFFSYLGGVWYGKDMRQAGWFDAIACDFGKPIERFTILAKGNDPSNPTDTFEILSRKFSRAFVVVKARPQKAKIFDETSATLHALPGKFRRLKTDGSLEDTAITSISLKNWEGAILIPDSIKDWKGPIFKDTSKTKAQTAIRPKTSSYQMKKILTVFPRQSNTILGKFYKLNGVFQTTQHTPGVLIKKQETKETK